MIEGARVKHPTKFLHMSVIGTNEGGKIELYNGVGNLWNIFYIPGGIISSNEEESWGKRQKRDSRKNGVALILLKLNPNFFSSVFRSDGASINLFI